ncbi:MAG: hypothetical protein FWC43_12430, partial [Planctomycetaceae bacterium]|nr:hypothetical protein [Planctomycetaceae bacterium]
FRFDWDEPQTVKEVVYFGRTAILMDECFKDYELLLDDDPTPVVKGTFQMIHGPQRVALPETKTVRSLTLRFLNAYTTTTNPGASEIAVFAQSPSDRDLNAISEEKRSAKEQELAKKVYRGGFGFNELLVVERHHLRLGHVYTYHVEGFVPGGGLCLFTPDENGGTLKKIVDAGEGMIIDADLHWNGHDIVFSWKRKGRTTGDTHVYLNDVSFSSNPEENYQIWTVGIDGSNLKQITNAPYNNLNACWLPDGGIAFISDRKPAYAYCWVVTSPVLYRMDRDGSNQKRLSANYLMDFTPSVLDDGRIIFTRWEYVDRAACPIQSLWTINPDGTNLAGFFGNRILAPGTFMDAKAISGSQKVIALATNHNGDCIGGIVQIDRRFGPNAKAGVLNTTPEVDVFNPGGQWGNGLSGPYEKPFPIDESVYLVTKSGAVQIRTVDGDRATLLDQDAKTGLGYYSVQPVKAFPTPPIVESVVDENVVLPEDGSVSGGWAAMVVQDVYNGLEPTIRRGEVKRIAVVQEIEKGTHSPIVRPIPGRNDGALETLAVFGFQFPLVSCGATYSPKKLWGFADVAEDGSASFMVPSEVPIYFLALDAEGRAVQRMRTFTHLMPGEVQSCVGCHTERNMVTPPRNPFLQERIEPQELTPPDWGVKGFSYQEVVQPVLDKHCLDCHNPRQKDGNLDLSGDYTDFFNVSYDHLARKGTFGERYFRHNGVRIDSRDEGSSPYTSWLWTINGSEWNILEVEPKRWGSPASLLAEIIRTGHPDKDGLKRIDMPPKDRERIYHWIDLNVPYYPTSASNHQTQLGCRRMYPENLDAVLSEVALRRCAECHASEIPREFYTRFMNPQDNAFLLAPLAKAAGGTQKCARIVFVSTDDPDYQKILETFRPVQELVERLPRADMPGFVEPPCQLRLGVTP